MGLFKSFVDLRSLVVLLWTGLIIGMVKVDSKSEKTELVIRRCI